MGVPVLLVGLGGRVGTVATGMSGCVGRGTLCQLGPLVGALAMVGAPSIVGAFVVTEFIVGSAVSGITVGLAVAKHSVAVPNFSHSVIQGLSSIALKHPESTSSFVIRPSSLFAHCPDVYAGSMKLSVPVKFEFWLMKSAVSPPPLSMHVMDTSTVASKRAKIHAWYVQKTV